MARKYKPLTRTSHTEEDAKNVSSAAMAELLNDTLTDVGVRLMSLQANTEDMFIVMEGFCAGLMDHLARTTKGLTDEQRMYLLVRSGERLANNVISLTFNMLVSHGDLDPQAASEFIEKSKKEQHEHDAQCSHT